MPMAMHAPQSRSTAVPEPPPTASLWLADGGRRALLTVVLPLLALALGAWVLTARGDDMVMGSAAFLLAWLVMMAAMMLPAAAPVVALYALAARRGAVAAVPVFVAGYLCVWAVSGLPAYAVAQALAAPLMEGEPWVARLVGGTLLGAAVYELTPLKNACLRRCRSPLSFYLSRRGSLADPRRAFATGVEHGLYCLGCCWALMAVLVVVGGMQLGWALALALVVSAEKLLPGTRLLVRLTAAAAALLGVALLLSPSLLDHLVLI
jgi:predicted metal-binding membrane protein